MSITINAAFSIISWDEKPTLELENGVKHTYCYNKYSYSGDMVGESVLEYLMFYREDGSGEVRGFERFTGTVAGKTGSFVIEHSGVFDKLIVNETYTIVRDSGTGELKGVTGTGKLSLDGHKEAYPITLEIELA